MKTLILTSLSLFVLAIANAQSIKTSSQIQKSKGNNNQQTQGATSVLTDADYFLSVAKVTLKTGKDNKELNSKLLVRVYPAAGTDNYQEGYFQDNYIPELKKWSTKEFFSDSNKKYLSTDLMKDEPVKETYLSPGIELLDYKAIERL